MLADLGLAEDQERVYLALLEVGPADRATLVGTGELIDLAPADVDEALDWLRVNYLVVRVGDSWSAVDPSVVLAERVSVLEQRASRARAVVEGLADRHRRSREQAADGAVEVVAEREVAARRVARTCATACREVLAMERPPYGQPQAAPNPLELDALRRGVVHRVLYEQAAVDQPGRAEEIYAGIAAGELARVAPSVPLRLLVVDRQVAFLPSRRGNYLLEPLLVVRPGSLLDALVALFEVTWTSAIPLHAGGKGPTTVDAGPDRPLLNLMSAGLTDVAIARQLGTSPRTIQRRIAGLTSGLGARTRFQAGVQAARHGWL